MGIRTIKSISIESAKESLNSKFAYLIFFFIMLLIYVAILTGIMAVNDEKKVLSDFFIAVTQISLLVFAIFSSALGVSQDIETKRIYLILSRPVKIYEYVFGRIIGVWISSFFILFLINLACFSVFVFKGYFFDLNYFYLTANLYFKILCISSISMFFACITTSSFTAIGISVMVWFVSHFLLDINYAFDKMKGAVHFMKYVIYLFPDFSSSPSLYSDFKILIYSFVVVLFSSYFFKKTEI